MNANEYVKDMVKRAREAQQRFAVFTQEQVDEAVRAVGKSVFDNAKPLAEMAVEETGIGNAAHKTVKNQAKPKATWWRLKGVKSRGVIRRLEEGVVEIAHPIGVLGCITPTTNPTMTPVHNAMIALKGGNAVIVGPHPRSAKTTFETVAIMRRALEEAGAPADLIQCVKEPSVAVSREIMEQCDATISTGGPGMVKAAYSVGKPAFGVGPGNVNVLIAEDAENLEAIAQKVAKGRMYDNGVLCTCEQSVIVPDSLYADFVRALEKEGAYYIDNPEEAARLGKAIFPDGTMDKRMVGATPAFIAEQAGIRIPEGTLFLAVRVEKTGDEGELLAKEKLSPVLALYRYNGFSEGVQIAYRNIRYEGTGHSAVIHTQDPERAEQFAIALPVARVGVNMVGSSGLGGAFDNGLMPTATLGCGTWGNNSVAGNLWWDHLVNISKLAYVQEDREIPSDADVWGE